MQRFRYKDIQSVFVYNSKKLKTTKCPALGANKFQYAGMKGTI